MIYRYLPQVKSIGGYARVGNLENKTVPDFMQQPGIYESTTPYGNNEKAGHYVQAGDGRFFAG